MSGRGMPYGGRGGGHPGSFMVPPPIMMPGGPNAMYYPIPRPGMGFYPYPQVPVSPNTTQVQLMVRQQIEYYFSVGNLVKDMYLRKNMDVNGWVPAGVIGAFNRMRMLTGGQVDPQFLVECCRDSDVVEIQGDNLRKRDDWAAWVMPNADSGGSSPASGANQPLLADQNGNGDTAAAGDATAAPGATVGDAEIAQLLIVVGGGAASEQADSSAGKEGGSWASIARSESKAAASDVVHFVFAPEGEGGGEREGVTYAALHDRCIAEHAPAKDAEGGSCRDLYAFWAYFLPAHFHAGMYAEFKSLAQIDAEAGDEFGMSRLFRFYRSRLEKAFEQALYNDFESSAVAAHERRGSKEGLQQLWNFHYYAQEKAQIGAGASKLLAEHFKPLE